MDVQTLIRDEIILKKTKKNKHAHVYIIWWNISMNPPLYFFVCSLKKKEKKINEGMNWEKWQAFDHRIRRTEVFPCFTGEFWGGGGGGRAKNIYQRALWRGRHMQRRRKSKAFREKSDGVFLEFFSLKGTKQHLYCFCIFFLHQFHFQWL